MLPTEFVNRLKRQEEDAFRELEHMSSHDPNRFRQFCYEFIMAGTYWEETVLCGFLMKTLAKAIGQTEAENWIRTEWNSMAELPRRTIAHCLQYPELALSTELAMELFRSPSTTSWERHLIVAGLASTARYRHCEALVLELADQIGQHEDPVRQATLEQLIKTVEDNFGSTAPEGLQPR